MVIAVRYKDWSRETPVIKEREFKTEAALVKWVERNEERGHIEVLATCRED
jgi:hypothetical protein